MIIKFMSTDIPDEYLIAPGVIPSHITAATFVTPQGCNVAVTIVHSSEWAYVSPVTAEGAHVLLECFHARAEIEVVSEHLTPPESSRT